MYIPEDREPVREYSVDDESIKNIMKEISGDQEFQDYVEKLTELLENVESKKVNRVINYLLYGMLLYEGEKLECISKAHSKLKELLESYYSSLDEVEEALSKNSEIEENTFPELVDSLRTDKDYYKKHKKAIDSYIKMLPEVRKNLEDVSRRIMGLE